MTVLDPQTRIATLESELQWAKLTIEKRDAQIRILEERLRQRRIQFLGPHSETLSDLQLELLAEPEVRAVCLAAFKELGCPPPAHHIAYFCLSKATLCAGSEAPASALSE